MDFTPVGAGLTQHFGLASAMKTDRPTAEEQEEEGRYPCIYIVMSRNSDLIKKFVDSDRGWEKINDSKKLIWTDEHANVLDIMVW